MLDSIKGIFTLPSPTKSLGFVQNNEEMTKLISELGYKSAQGCEMARYSLHFIFIGQNGHLKRLVS